MARVCPELVGLAGPFTRIARAMSSEWSVRIVPSGARCDTDGEVIRIPFTADYLPRDMRQVLHGMLDHEVCHVAEERRHKKAVRQSPLEIMEAEADKRVKLLFNVVEDVRIEKRYSERYLGVAQNIAASNLKCANDWAAKPSASSSWWHRFGAALVLLAHGLPAAWAEDEFGEHLRACAPELARMRAGVGEWCDASLDVAKRIADKVKVEEEKRDSDKDADKGDGEGSGGDDGGDRDGGDDADTDDSAALKSKRGPGEEPDDTDLLAGMRSAIEDYVIQDARAFGRYIPHPKAHALDEVREADGALRVYKEAFDEVIPQIRALRQKQRALVSSYARRRVRPGLDRGEIDDTTVADVRLGSTDVFSELTRKRLLDTAICGLVDCSGSMGDNRHPMCGAYYALRTAVALAESWSALGVANEWLGFTALDHIDPGITPDELDGPFFCRPPLCHLVFKAYGERLRDVRERFGGIIGRGSNVDGEAVLWAWRRLIVRAEKRRILVVVSDGQPASSNGCRASLQIADELAMQTHLRDVIKAATQSGVEVIGIGAGTSLPRAYFNKDTGAKFVYVRNIGTLAMDVYRVMSKRVTDLA